MVIAQDPIKKLLDEIDINMGMNLYAVANVIENGEIYLLPHILDRFFGVRWKNYPWIFYTLET